MDGPLCPKSKRITSHCLFNFDHQYITHQEKWSCHSCNSYCWNICKLRYLAMAWNVCKLRYLAMAWNVCKLRYLVMTGSGWKVISSGGVIVTCPNQIEHWAVLLWDKCCLLHHLLWATFCITNDLGGNLLSYLASKLQAGLGKFAPLAPSVGGDFFADGIYTSRANTIHSVWRMCILPLG